VAQISTSLFQTTDHAVGVDLFLKIVVKWIGIIEMEITKTITQVILKFYALIVIG